MLYFPVIFWRLVVGSEGRRCVCLVAALECQQRVYGIFEALGHKRPGV